MSTEFFERLRTRFTSEKKSKLEEESGVSEWKSLINTRLNEAYVKGVFPRFTTQVGYDLDYITFAQRDDYSIIYYVRYFLDREIGKRAVLLNEGKFKASLVLRNDKDTVFQNIWTVSANDEESTISQHLLNTLKLSSIFLQRRDGGWLGGSPQESAILDAYNSALANRA